MVKIISISSVSSFDIASPSWFQNQIGMQKIKKKLKTSLRYLWEDKEKVFDEEKKLGGKSCKTVLFKNRQIPNALGNVVGSY